MPFCDSALVQVLEQWELAFLGRDDQLADVAILDALAVAVLPQRAPAFDAELGLERAGLVVDARMDDAAVVAGLMRGKQLLFLEQDELEVRMAQEQLPRRRQADDAAADDRDVVRHIVEILASGGLARYRKSGKADLAGCGETSGHDQHARHARYAPFKNEVVKSFTDAGDAAAMRTALATVQSSLRHSTIRW